LLGFLFGEPVILFSYGTIHSVGHKLVDLILGVPTAARP